MTGSNCAALVAGLILVPSLAFAGSGGGEAHLDPIALGRHLVNLVALIAVLVWGLKGPLADFLKFRRREIKDQLDASEKAKAEAEAKYQDIEGRLKNFEAEMETLLAGVREEGEAERVRLIAQAESSAEQLQVAAARTVEEEVRRARHELRAEAIDLAVELAEKIIVSEVGDADQRRLAAEYLSRVQEASA